MKRIGIYLTYDKQKIVDRYIGYMLKELKSCVDFLVIVCNETEVVRGIDILEMYGDEIFYRKNIGFDAGGFKDALCKFVGWERILEYDELVLVNDSMFGPFRPMRSIFSEMENKKVDFWGLAKHGECINREYGYYQEHIQSYFVVTRFRMLHCSEFREYWEMLPYYDTFIDTILQHEVKFTPYFANLGFSYAALANTEVNDSKNISNNYMQYGAIAYELIKKRNFPFLKKQQIAYETLDRQTQENLKQAINYIDLNTEYDVDLIWENIIRTINVADLQRSLHLQYIIPSKKGTLLSRKFIILIIIAFKESAEYVLDYLEELDLKCFVKILAENKEYFDIYEKNGFECIEITLKNIADILLKFADYEFVCVLHDTDMTSNRKSSCIGKSYFYNIWENLAKNREHVNGIIEEFVKESHLGFLTPPQPNFEEYFGEYGKKWNGKYERVRHIIELLNLDCQISEGREPLRVTDNFWVRGCVLQKIGQIKIQDRDLLSYIWTYLAQDAGFYSGIVESIDYASMNEVNLQYYLQKITFNIRQLYGDFNTFFELQEKLLKGSEESWLFKLQLSKLMKYCEGYSKILLYGAGTIAQLYQKYLPKIEAYIVTDGQIKPEMIDEIPVKYLSEIKNLEEYGIILCINQNNQRQVIPVLESCGGKHYICI